MRAQKEAPEYQDSVYQVFFNLMIGKFFLVSKLLFRRGMLLLATEIKLEISTLQRIIRKKLDAYTPETVSMPFHYRLRGKDRCAMFSFLQSMNTTFGTSIWEQVAEILAKRAKLEVKRQYHLTGEIDQDTEALIRHIHLKLRKGETIPDKDEEIELIRHLIKPGVKNTKDPDRVVDLFVKIGNKENYFDITSNQLSLT